MVIIKQSAATNTAEASDLDSGERVDRARYLAWPRSGDAVCDACPPKFQVGFAIFAI